jgi:TonB-dependent starch-binding outer membrane protein SusC
MKNYCFTISGSFRRGFMLFLMSVIFVQFSLAQRNISGSVTSAADNELLPGVTVLEKGTRNGTTTDASGRYNILVSEKSTLVFSFVGMLTQEIPVGNQTVIDVAMMNDFLGLEEVVIVGYGSMMRRDLTGSIASLTSREIEATPILSMEQSMSGRLAGVHVTQSSHAPGGGISVRIRGGNSINSNVEPLYIIDGFPVYSNNSQIPSSGPADGVMPQMNLLAGINPGDIERIEVLKDGSSTAIYGARGANGVIIITTKRGAAGAPRVDYSTYYSMERIANKLELLDAYQFAVIHNELSINSSQPLRFTGQTIDGVYYGHPEEYNSTLNPGGALRSTDWQNEILRTGGVRNHQLSLSGGSETTQYALSVNNLRHDGIVIGGDFGRTSIRTNMDSKVNNWLSVGNSLTYSYNLSNNSGSETGLQWFNGGTISSAIKSWPMFAPYDEEGNLNVQAGAATLRGNPVAYALDAKNRLNNSRVLGNLFGTITFSEALSLRVSAGVDLNSIERGRYFPATTYEGFLTSGSASRSNSNINSWLNENILTYNKSAGIHRFNAVAGFTLQKEVVEGSGMSASGFLSDIFQDHNMSSGANQTYPAYSWKNQWTMASWLGRINYSLKEKYLLTLTGRADGSSRFGAENRWAFFPSVAVAWRASEEEFIRDLNLFSHLRLRFSAGTTGNSEIGLYQSQALLGMQSYTFGAGSISPGVGPTRMANPDLKWETTTQYDGGVEFGFMHNRLNFIIDYYHKKTTDLLLSAVLPGISGFLPPLLGFSLPPQNIGTLENKGIEFTANYDVLTGPFSWNVSGNIYSNRNKILDIGGREGFTIRAANDLDKHGGSVYIDVGLPVGVWRRTVYDGVFRDQEAVDAYVNSEGDPIQPGAQPGDVRYLDVNGDGIFDGKDLAVAGDPNPDYIFGLNNELSYSNFTLTVFINGSQGNDINAPTFVHATNLSSMGDGNLIADMWNRWTPENPDTHVPRPGANYTWGNDMIYDGSFVRIKNIRLSYNLPANNILWLRNAQVYFNITNLYTFTNYPGYDPEVNSTGQSPWQRGIDLNAFPATRSLMFGIQVGL